MVIMEDVYDSLTPIANTRKVSSSGKCLILTKSRKMIWAVLSHVWERLKVYKILVGQPKWRKLPGKP